MIAKLTLYTRRDCCLCEEMKAAIREAAGNCEFSLDEIDVDDSAELCLRYGNEVPVLFIDGRKAFKYRLTARELAQRLTKRASLLNRLFNSIRASIDL